MKLLVVCEGRSGSRWLATLLKETGCKAAHESGLAGASHMRARWSKVQQTLQKGRLPGPQLVKKAISEKPRDWIEVDGNWLFYVPTFLDQGVKVLHLVRDGRDVVRSYMARRKRAVLFRPPAGLDYFGRMCHRWQYKVRWLATRKVPFLRFEDAVSDFDSLTEVLEPFGIHVKQEIWEELRGIRINRTLKHAIPPWREWDDERKLTFWKIAKHAMGIYGYGHGGK